MKTGWMYLKWDPIICWLQETYLSDNIRLKVQRQKILLQGNGIWKKIIAAAVIPDEAKISKRNEEGNYILIKGIIYQEYITMINTYIPNTIGWEGTEKYNSG